MQSLCLTITMDGLVSGQEGGTLFSLLLKELLPGNGSFTHTLTHRHTKLNLSFRFRDADILW